TWTSPANWAARTPPSGCGVAASPSAASAACSTPPDPAARRSFPPEMRLHVLELATAEDPADAGCPAGSWSLGELALTVLREANPEDRLRAGLAAAGVALGPALLWPMSRSTVGRILAEAELKPHRSAYWLDSHAPGFADRAREICQLYLDAPRL